MNQQIPSDKALRSVLEKLEAPLLSDRFAAETMQRIVLAEKKRRERNIIFGWAALIAVSCLLIGGMVWIFRYLSIDLSPLFKNIISMQNLSFSGSAWILSLFVGSVALMLLFLDFYVRKLWTHEK